MSIYIRKMFQNNITGLQESMLCLVWINAAKYNYKMTVLPDCYTL